MATLSFIVETFVPPPPKNRVVQVRYSKDGGRNWSDWRTRSLGELGAFQDRVVLRRLGRGRQWVFDVKVTDDVKRDLIAASLQLEGGEG